MKNYLKESLAFLINALFLVFFALLLLIAFPFKKKYLAIYQVLAGTVAASIFATATEKTAPIAKSIIYEKERKRALTGFVEELYKKGFIFAKVF